MSEFIEFLPQLEVPCEMAAELEGLTIDDLINGTIQYEVIGKNEGGVRLKIKSIVFKNKKTRVING